MSSTIFVHSVTVDMVLDTLPVNTTQVTATSNGLNLGLVEGYISRAAGQVNALLVRHGMSPESLDPNSSQVAQDAIVAYSAAYSLERLGASPDQIERRLREYKELINTLKTDPQSLGSAQDQVSALGVKSNISNCNPSRFRAGRYRYW